MSTKSKHNRAAKIPKAKHSNAVTICCKWTWQDNEQSINIAETLWINWAEPWAWNRCTITYFYLQPVQVLFHGNVQDEFNICHSYFYFILFYIFVTHEEVQIFGKIFCLGNIWDYDVINIFIVNNIPISYYKKYLMRPNVDMLVCKPMLEVKLDDLTKDVQDNSCHKYMVW